MANVLALKTAILTPSNATPHLKPMNLAMVTLTQVNLRQLTSNRLTKYLKSSRPVIV
jgi:hypothetical protein